MGVLLACAGIYGLVSMLVGQSAHEIAIHMALGAKATAVIRRMVFQACTCIGIGALAGTCCSLTLASRRVGPPESILWSPCGTNEQTRIDGVIQDLRYAGRQSHESGIGDHGLLIEVRMGAWSSSQPSGRAITGLLSYFA